MRLVCWMSVLVNIAVRTPRLVNARLAALPVAFLPFFPLQNVTRTQVHDRAGRFRLNSSGRTSPPDIPTRDFGYRTEPFSWHELQQLIVVEQNLAGLSRSVEQERTYGKHREEILKEYASVYDYILHSKLGIPKRFNPQSRRWESPLPSDPSERRNPKTALVPNDFPYFCREGIEHWVLWKLYGKIDPDDVEKAKLELSKRLKLGYAGVDGKRFIAWENPPYLKSLPEIDHVHILVLRSSPMNGSW